MWKGLPSKITVLFVIFRHLKDLVINLNEKVLLEFLTSCTIPSIELDSVFFMFLSFLYIYHFNVHIEPNLSLIPAIPSGIASIPNCSKGVDLRNVKFLLKFVEPLKYVWLLFTQNGSEENLALQWWRNWSYSKLPHRIQRSCFFFLCYLCNRNWSHMNTEVLLQGGRGWAGC